MIKKLILLKDFIKDADDRNILNDIIKVADEMGTFHSNLAEHFSLDANKITRLGQMLILIIKNKGPDLFKTFLNEKSIILNDDQKSKVIEYFNNNASEILMSDIDFLDFGENSILDSYIISSLEEPEDSESEYSIGKEDLEEYHQYLEGVEGIDVDAPPEKHSGPLRLPIPREESTKNVEIPVANVEMIMENLISEYIRQYKYVIMNYADIAEPRKKKRTKSEQEFLDFMNRIRG